MFAPAGWLHAKPVVETVNGVGIRSASGVGRRGHGNRRKLHEAVALRRLIDGYGGRLLIPLDVSILIEGDLEVREAIYTPKGAGYLYNTAYWRRPLVDPADEVHAKSKVG